MFINVIPNETDLTRPLQARNAVQQNAKWETRIESALLRECSHLNFTPI